MSFRSWISRVMGRDVSGSEVSTPDGQGAVPPNDQPPSKAAAEINPDSYDWRELPASPGQVAFMKKLGCRPRPGLTKGQASEIIDRAQEKRDDLFEEKAKLKPQVMHYFAALWHEKTGHKCGEFGIEQPQISLAANELLETETGRKAAGVVGRMLDQYPHSEQFLQANPPLLKVTFIEFLEKRWGKYELLEK